jgi:hypothetical protein
MRVAAACAVLGLASLVRTMPVSAQLVDTLAHAPADYFSRQPPAAGGSYVDPTFGTSIRRLSDALATPDDASGGTLTFIMNEYSTPSIYNGDDSYFVLGHQSYFAIYGKDGRYVKDAPLEMNASTEPRWSRRNPNVVYFKSGNALKQYDVTTGQIVVVHTFAEYARVTGRGESDICFDGDHFVLVGDDREIFVYEISTDRKGPVFSTDGHDFDSVYISADDDVTITWLQAGTGRFQGIELFDRSMNFLRQVARAGGHMDMTRDANGDAVLVWANGGDPDPICDNGIVKIRLSDAQQTCLLTLDESLAAHVSGSDQDWVVVSTYAPSDPSPGGAWPVYTNEILRLNLAGGPVERLAHHRSRPSNDYNWEPKATINRDGTRIVYGSNFGLTMTEGYPKQYSDAYLIQFEPPAGGGGGCHSSPAAAARLEGGALVAQLALALAPVGAIVVVGRGLARRRHWRVEEPV